MICPTPVNRGSWPFGKWGAIRETPPEADELEDGALFVSVSMGDVIAAAEADAWATAATAAAAAIDFFERAECDGSVGRGLTFETTLGDGFAGCDTAVPF